MDALGALYLIDTDDYDEDRRERRMTGRTLRPLGAAQGSGTGAVVSIVMLAVSVCAAYLCYNSETIIDRALTRVAPGSAAGGFVNAVKSMGAFGGGISYLLYYAIAKRPRIQTLLRAMSK